MSISEVFRIHARHRADKDALVEGDRRISFRSLDRRLNNFCFSLRKLGVKPGERIGLALGDTSEHLIALLGLARLGAVIVPLDHRWNAMEQISVASSFGAERILVEQERAEREPCWVRVQPDWFAESDEVYVDDTIGPASPLIMSLSSGTTGKPKGPCASHRQYESRFMVYWLNLGLNANDRYISATPLYFGGGRGFAWGMLFAGATVFLYPPPFEPDELVDYVRRTDATAMFLVPTLIRRVLELPLRELAFPSIKCLISSGSALYSGERQTICERLTPHLFEMYSSSEGGAISVMSPEDRKLRPDSVGRACFRVEAEVVDERHVALPNGETGRLRYRSPASPTEYLVGDSDDEVFRDGWYYPGDLAAIADDGFISLRGRAKDMIIRGGVNIYPGDIEQLLVRTDLVRDVAVVGIPSAELGEEVAAFVVPTESVTSDALSDVCRSNLAPYKVPKIFVFLDELPRNSGGKILKTELAKLATEMAPMPRASMPGMSDHKS